METEDKLSDMTLLKLSLQRALLGEVSENLCAVTAGIEGENILISAYFYGPVKDSDIETIQSVSTEVVTDFAYRYQINEFCYSIATEKLEVLDFWAFMRQQ